MHRDSATFGGAQQLQLMAVLALPVLPGGGVNDIFTNRVFLAGFWAWFTAQTLKVRAQGLRHVRGCGRRAQGMRPNRMCGLPRAFLLNAHSFAARPERSCH
jgi:hypothetical protein